MMHQATVMKRDLVSLTGQEYDLLVIGGGITGANVAWDATLRGLRVALLEKRDFGAATSANSLKTVHGGLRYLQDGSLRLVRKMVRERQALLRIAPHLVHPLPVIMPTAKGKLMRSKLVLGTAVKLNDLFSLDRNLGMDPSRKLPNGRILSRSEAAQMLPGLDHESLSGAVMWHDAQVYNSERLLLAFLLAAAQKGAQIANYVGVTGFLREGERVVGVTAVDELTGTPLQVRAQLVVNAAGPWIDQLLADLGTDVASPQFKLSTAMNLVTRQIVPNYAVGLTSHYEQSLPDGSVAKRSRVLFIAPWRDYSLVGTLHAPYNGQPDDNWLSEQTIMAFIDEVNQAYPGAKLSRQDVYQVHRGFLPAAADNPDPATVKLVREGQVTDHAIDSGVEGLVTAVGVKYTTARYLAEKVVDLAYKKLKRPIPDCQTRQHPICGGYIRHFEAYRASSIEQWPLEMPLYQLERLLRNYGSTHRHLLPYFSADQEWQQPVSAETDVTRAELVHAMRQEMACKLSDLVLRRTEIGSARQPDPATLHACARLMAVELGWDKKRMDQEVEEVMGVYSASLS
jgi:glycerol-3-phosphate dehydrogenase